MLKNLSMYAFLAKMQFYCLFDNSFLYFLRLPFINACCDTQRAHFRINIRFYVTIDLIFSLSYLKPWLTCCPSRFSRWFWASVLSFGRALGFLKQAASSIPRGPSLLSPPFQTCSSPFAATKKTANASDFLKSKGWSWFAKVIAEINQQSFTKL